MSMFKEILGSGETLFKNEESLDPEWIPKLLPHRENQQFRIANCIKPLLQNRNGRNSLIFGVSGIGKTAAVKWVLRDLEENSDDVYLIYINCWQKNTKYKIIAEICAQINYLFVQNKNTEELFEVIKSMINKKSAVFVFDEIDKLEEIDFIYAITNEIYKKSIILITNYKDWYSGIDDRIRSRLTPENIEFTSYNKQEIKDILNARIEYAFFPNLWNEENLFLIIDKSFEAKDIRIGLKLLRESGLIAEEESSKKILKEHVQKALNNLNIEKGSEGLDQDERLALRIIKESNEEKIGDLYKKYQDLGGQGAYKSFQRRIERLEKGKFIKTKKLIGGKEGSTTIIEYKTLTEY